jgi:hypothetical protein
MSRPPRRFFGRRSKAIASSDRSRIDNMTLDPIDLKKSMHPKTVKTGLLDNDNPQRPVLRVGASDDAKSVAAARARLKDHLLSGALYPLVKVGGTSRCHFQRDYGTSISPSTANSAASRSSERGHGSSRFRRSNAGNAKGSSASATAIKSSCSPDTRT